METTYIVKEDLQEDEFKVGFTGTAEDFKKVFLPYLAEYEWLKSDWNTLNSLEGKAAIDFIASYWELRIEEVK